MTLPELLADCYLTKQPWQTRLMPREDIVKYFHTMIERGNIIAEYTENELLGYVESWHINYEQFGRIICDTKNLFFTYNENTTNGNICYLANIWINPKCRQGIVFKNLESEFFKRNNNCDYYVGHAWRKTSGLIKTFRKDQLISKLFTGV